MNDAKVLLQQGERLQAMALMAEVLARDPANISALNSYGPLLVQMKTASVPVLTSAIPIRATLV